MTNYQPHRCDFCSGTVKATVAHFSRDDAWALPRPPLVALSESERARCVAALADIGFAMPGLG